MSEYEAGSREGVKQAAIDLINRRVDAQINELKTKIAEFQSKGWSTTELETLVGEAEKSRQTNIDLLK